MSQQKQQTQTNSPVTILSIKKNQKGTVTVKPAKGLKMFLDGKEVQFETAEYNGKSGEFLYLNRVEDEINRINSLVEEGRMKEETANKILDSLNKQKEWGITSFVKAKLK
jgi:hypothetical protein